MTATKRFLSSNWFRVAALGTAGPSHWTDAVSVVTQ